MPSPKPFPATVFNMDRKKDPRQKKKYNPSPSSLRRSNSFANLRQSSTSRPPANPEGIETASSSTSIPHASTSSHQPSNPASRNHNSDHSQPNLRLPRSASSIRNITPDAIPVASSSHQQQRSELPTASSSQSLDPFDSVSSPVLSLRKGSNTGAPRASASHQSRLQDGRSQGRLGNILQGRSAGNPQHRASRVAGGASSLVCPTCGTPLPDRESYRKHLKALDHGHACESCGSKFADKGNLNRHIRSVHQRDNKPYTCDLCGLGFTFRDGLRRHVDAVHWQIRAFRCASCEKAYKKKDHLKRHLAAFPGHKAANP